MKLGGLNKSMIVGLLWVGVCALPSFGADAAPTTGKVMVDGSSTVFPITEAVAEEFQNQNQQIKVTVGMSGTGGGFKKFTKGEIDINDASRPIKPEEIAEAKKHGIEYLEIPIAFDGLSVVVNKANTDVKTLTMAELGNIWKPGSAVTTWNQVRPQWKNEKIKLYGPGTDSGTFDYFTEVVNGKAQVSRNDYTKSEDDNSLVQGVAGDKWSLGYFGFAYYHENAGKINAVAIDAGKGAIMPTPETINNGTYPLSRKIFIYVNKAAAKRPEIQAFINFYIQNAAKLSKEVGYVPLPAKDYEAGLKSFKKFSG